MDPTRKKTIIWICSGALTVLGGVLMYISQVSYSDAKSNVSGWAGGVSKDLGELLTAPSVDYYVTLLGAALIIAALWFATSALLRKHGGTLSFIRIIRAGDASRNELFVFMGMWMLIIGSFVASAHFAISKRDVLTGEKIAKQVEFAPTSLPPQAPKPLDPSESATPKVAETAKPPTAKAVSKVPSSTEPKITSVIAPTKPRQYLGEEEYVSMISAIIGVLRESTFGQHQTDSATLERPDISLVADSIVLSALRGNIKARGYRDLTDPVVEIPSDAWAFVDAEPYVGGRGSYVQYGPSESLQNAPQWKQKEITIMIEQLKSFRDIKVRAQDVMTIYPAKPM